MKAIFSVIIFFAAGIAFNGCAENQKRGLTIKDGILLVGVEAGYPPMEYYASDAKTLQGFDIELTKALADKLGLRVKYIDTAWEGIFAGLETREYDVAVNITVLPSRQARHNFTKPYIGNSMTIVTLKTSAQKIEKPEDIAGCRVAFQGDTTAQYFAQKLAADGTRFSALSYDKIINCFDELLLKRVDCVLVDSLAAHEYAAKAGSPFAVRWCGPANETIALCLKKGNDELTAALDAALDELFAEGFMAKISEDTFGQDMVSSVRAAR